MFDDGKLQKIGRIDDDAEELNKLDIDGVTVEQLLEVYTQEHGIYDPKEEGQGMVEYALILVLMAIVCLVVAGTLGQRNKELWSKIVSAMP